MQYGTPLFAIPAVEPVASMSQMLRLPPLVPVVVKLSPAALLGILAAMNGLGRVPVQSHIAQNYGVYFVYDLLLDALCDAAYYGTYTYYQEDSIQIAMSMLPTTQNREVCRHVLHDEKCIQNTVPFSTTSKEKGASKWHNKVLAISRGVASPRFWNLGGYRPYNPTKPKRARKTVRLHEASLSRGAGAVASPVITCAESRQVHVYRQPVEEVNHSGCARSAFEGKSLGIELACMQSRTGQRWRSWDHHMVGFAKKAGDEASTVNSSLGGTGQTGDRAKLARRINN